MVFKGHLVFIFLLNYVVLANLYAINVLKIGGEVKSGSLKSFRTTARDTSWQAKDFDFFDAL